MLTALSSQPCPGIVRGERSCPLPWGGVSASDYWLIWGAKTQPTSHSSEGASQLQNPHGVGWALPCDCIAAHLLSLLNLLSFPSPWVLIPRVFPNDLSGSWVPSQSLSLRSLNLSTELKKIKIKSLTSDEYVSPQLSLFLVLEEFQRS